MALRAAVRGWLRVLGAAGGRRVQHCRHSVREDHFPFSQLGQVQSHNTRYGGPDDAPAGLLPRAMGSEDPAATLPRGA
eukprot:2879190-Prorocentrum_lima.AAC.1